MNVPGTTGESSCKRQENGDSTMESERPLKKARFAWQVKGKYHLKNEIAEAKTSVTSAIVHNESEKVVSLSDNEDKSNNLVGTTEQNLEILGDYLLKQDYNNTFNSVITDCNKSLVPRTSILPEKLPYPRYKSSYDNNSSIVIKPSSDKTLTPMSKLLAQSYNEIEDQCIARWQERQVAQGFVDNTINRVLDSWMEAPLTAPVNSNRFLAFDVAEFINNLPGDNSIENEGILMAISAHGLQNTPNTDSTKKTDKGSSTATVMFLSPPSSPLPSDEDTHEGIIDNKPISTETTSSSEFDMSWTYSDDRRTVNNELSFFPDTSNSSVFQCFSESNHPQTPNNEYEADDILHNHYDFLDTAVTFAIQNKGLTSFGSDYG